MDFLLLRLGWLFFFYLSVCAAPTMKAIRDQSMLDDGISALESYY